MVTTTATPASARGRGWRMLLLGLVLGVAGTGFLAMAVGAPLTIAHRNNLPLERWYGDAAVGIASRFAAGSAGVATNPVAGDPRAIATGSRAYIGSCAVCHNANGDGKGAFGPATFPPATDLTSHDAKEKTDGQLFWIVKNGLSFTGMPGFGSQYNDQEIWSLVSYIRSLQGGGSRSQSAPATQSSQAAGRESGREGGREGGRGETTVLTSLVVPTPTGDELGMADISGDAVHRGAAVYFAQGCASCHGATGNAGGELGLRSFQAREAAEAVRQGRPGMPAYRPSQISDRQVAVIAAYMGTFPGRPGGAESGRFDGPGQGGAQPPPAQPGRA